MSPFTIEQKEITTELTDFADRGFERHGLEVTGIHEPILRTAFVAHDSSQFAGCVTASILWKALQIRHMFIEDSYRRQGLGRLLIQKALDYGRLHECPIAFVDTFSFQALGFYQKLGFTLEFTRTGFPHGHSLHYLKKDLL